MADTSVGHRACWWYNGDRNKGLGISSPLIHDPDQIMFLCVPPAQPTTGPYWAILGQAEGLVFFLHRFQCSSCSRNWASAQVQVLFHMHWSEGESRGRVKMRVFAQRCQKCSQPSFEVPKFTEGNISRILNNLVLQILKKCYREGFTLVEIPMIKEISLEGPHDSDNCEACLQGFCVQSELGLAKWSPVSPLPPTISSPILGITTEKPSPTRSSTRGDAVKKKKVLPRQSFPETTQAESLPISWSPRANTNFQAERRDQNSFNNCTFSSHTAQRTRSLGVSCCCCLMLIIIIVIVVKTTI